MEAMEMIRLARPQVAMATPDETAAIRASFERRIAEPQHGLWSRLKRLTRRQAAVGIVIAAVVPAGAVAVADKLNEPDRSAQIDKALSLIPVAPAQKQAESMVDACRAAAAKGVANDPCKDLLREIDRAGGEYVPGAPTSPVTPPEP